MIVDFRPHARLRDRVPRDITGSVSPVLEALGEERADLARVRLVYDWVQYRENFRDVVDVRPILSRAAPGDDAFEVAVDVRRGAGLPLRELTAERLREKAGDVVFLEDWGPTRESRIWDFNTMYWSALRSWEEASGQEYEQALPGGRSDARNRDAAADVIRDLFAVWDRLADTGALPEELYVVELGVGNGNQARVFLDVFRDLDHVHGRGYYDRLRYLMCDYSQHVLDLARENVAGHAARVASYVAEASRPCDVLGFLRGRVFLVYVSNVYDNLPTDEVAHLAGRTYRVETRACLPATGAAELAAALSASPVEIPALVGELLRLGPDGLAAATPELFPGVAAAVDFWRRTWSMLRLKERYVPLGALDLYALAPSVSGEMLRPLLESGGDIRMHVSNGALAGFVDSLTLLHPFGMLVCHDLFVTDVQGYRTGFRGPGKYDGSVVNWVNGPLLAHVGRRMGFDVRFTPFRHTGGGNIVTLTAQVGD
ncbi:class I SAM-dependent methyltransferase [Microbispora sp. CA-102843]|uniref:class I SAM-dependent methyltransferase n=1 Tax=Microbispora sp. CA-102843 TaxID=3239952 RepID=UPI003D938A82